MNVATVFKQSTTTSARMSSNIHHHQRTELSALSGSIRFDHNLNRKNGKLNGLVTALHGEEQSSYLSSSPKFSSSTKQQQQQPKHQQALASSKAASSTITKSSVQRKPIKSNTVLMESNAILNVVQRPGQHQQNFRRHSMSVQDERLLKILKSAPDEPLYMTSPTTPTATATAATSSNHRSIINDSNKCTADNLLMQYESATSSITTTCTTDNNENENRPPPTTDKNTVAANTIGDGNNLDNMSSTPQKGFSAAAWNMLQRDLNSPSASCRIRAIRAINSSPANPNYYSSNFDAVDDAENGSHNDTDADIERSIEKPKTMQEVMQNVIVYVEYRSNTENRTIGIKDYIAKLGAKVNDRLLRNTTHVVFKDGLQSTYNKAKSWNIPIVSILWIEACKKHLVLMNPSAYKIPDIEKYENPDLYEKTKRHKYIQPDTLMKNLHRPIPKSKILEELKKTNDSHANQSAAAASKAASSSQSLISQSLVSSPNVTQRKVPTGASIKSSQSRKSLSKKVDEKPKNTIQSMFAKQLEKSQRENSQINGTIDQITTLNINESNGTSSKVSETVGESTANDLESNPSQEILVNGSLHKRLTRRNSMTLRTPTKSITTIQSDDIVPATPSSIKKRRCTMFTPSLKLSIEEEISDSKVDDNATSTTTTTPASASSSSTNSTSSNKTIIVANKTLNNSIAMDVCNVQSKARETRNAGAVTKSSSIVRQLLNDDLSKSSHESSSLLGTSASSMDGTKFLQPKIRLPLQTRRTTFTVQPMDETKVLQSNSNISTTGGTSTPVSLTKRRNTLNMNGRTGTPQSKVVAELNKSNSCDAILTPTNKINDMNHVLSSTPSFQSLSQAHRAHIRNSTSKTLLDEYNNTFSSTKTPMSEKRRTLSNIALDIIKQRVENINRNASFNRSMHDLHDDAAVTGYDDIKKVAPVQLDAVPVATPPASAIRPIESEATTNVTPIKPMKRKLFAPPSLFPEHSPIGLVTPQKTDTKKTVNQKRKRNDVCAVKDGVPSSSSTASTLSKSDEKKKPTEKPRTNNNRKTIAHSRRSTMFFETPPSAAATAKKATQSSTSATNPTAIGTPSLVFTSMHQPQIDFITETVKKLGKFKLDDKVNSHTTHLVALDGRRTINMLRALIRGVWILKYDWIVESSAAKQWLPELDYEMHEFSKAVEVNRIERQAFGSSYKMDLFRNFDTIYVSPKCACKQLKELITLCHGRVIQNERLARYIICECYQTHVDSQKCVQLHPNWILDSISAGKIQKLTKYIHKPNV